ncbi:hypothetical protein KY332_01405 [Candidatus Woesearchaeota archaeon]|nr:hypothetical protein [Candidatus Woesearchaeota archaeon]
MKKILFALLVIAILVSGCGGEGEVVDRKTGVTVRESDLGTETRKSYSTPKATGPVLTSEINTLLAKADSVSSLEYSHNEFVLGEAGYHAEVWLKGNKMKHKISLQAGTSQGVRYDTIYFDLAKREAIGYCEELSRCEEKLNIPSTLSIDSFTTETPFDVADQITVGSKIGSAMFDKREVMIVEYEQGGNQVRVYLWDYKGLPLKYEVRDGEELLKKVEYLGLVINGVKDDDFVYHELKLPT